MAMKGFESGQFTQIKGLSDRRRLPRLGKIRLGYKVKNKRKSTKCRHKADEVCEFCTHPVETPYFVVPPEVAEKLGNDKPTELDVMLPVNDPGVVFPQRFIWYGSSKGAKCVGNGEVAQRIDGENMISMECSEECPQRKSGECTQRASLMVILPGVSMGGIWQVDSTSYHSIVDINSGMAYIAAMMEGLTGEPRFSMIPLVLKRIARTTHEGGVKGTHYTMHLHSKFSMKELVAWSDRKFDRYALPAPEQLNPATDKEGLLDEERAKEIIDVTTTTEESAEPAVVPEESPPRSSPFPPPPFGSKLLQKNEAIAISLENLIKPNHDKFKEWLVLKGILKSADTLYDVLPASWAALLVRDWEHGFRQDFEAWLKTQ